VASRARKPTTAAPRGVSASAVPAAEPCLPNLEAFVLHGEGQISIGAIRPIACAAIANDEHDMLAALVRRPDETLAQLLERLDRALQRALDDNIRTDEINPPASPRRR
jgi:hypothetical protein